MAKQKKQYRIVSVRVTVEEFEAIQRLADKRDQYVSPLIAETMAKSCKRAGVS